MAKNPPIGTHFLSWRESRHECRHECRLVPKIIPSSSLCWQVHDTSPFKPTMDPTAAVAFVDLLDAYEWVSAAAFGENAAYLSRLTGKTFIDSDALDELPDDIEDGSAYLAVPHKAELRLGRELAINFSAEHLPDAAGQVSGFFRQRGAYGRFKDLLERTGCLEAWYEYEAKAVERALRGWCDENHITLLG